MWDCQSPWLNAKLILRQGGGQWIAQIHLGKEFLSIIVNGNLLLFCQGLAYLFPLRYSPILEIK